MTYEKAIKAIDEHIRLDEEKIKLMHKLKLSLILEKEFSVKKNGGEFAIINKADYLRNYIHEIRHSIWHIPSYKGNMLKDKVKDSINITLIYDIKNKRHIEVENLVLEKGRFVMKCHKSEVDK